MKTPLTDDYVESLVGISDADPKPFYYSRLIGRMQKKVDPVSVWKPSFALALSLLLALNVYFLKNDSSKQKNINPIQEFANSYQLTGDFNY